MTYKEKLSKLIELRKTYKSLTDAEKLETNGLLLINQIRILVNYFYRIDESIKINHKPIGNYTQKK